LENQLDVRDSAFKALMDEFADAMVEALEDRAEKDNLKNVKLPRTRKIGVGGTVIGFLTGWIRPWRFL
jgi:hypothetical protein